LIGTVKERDEFGPHPRSPNGSCDLLGGFDGGEAFLVVVAEHVIK
jgi:hypothetical protein